VEQSTAEALNIDMCLNLKVVKEPDAGATGYFVAISKHL
jgi:hypothetical protein